MRGEDEDDEKQATSAGFFGAQAINHSINLNSSSIFFKYEFNPDSLPFCCRLHSVLCRD